MMNGGGRRYGMSWRKVAKSLQRLGAHVLLLSFTFLLVYKLDHMISYSWWMVFSPIWLFHLVIARGRFSLPAPSVPHDRHWAPCHAIVATPLMVAFELLLCIYLESLQAGIPVVSLKIVFIPLLTFQTIVLIDNFRMCRALMPGDEEGLSDEAIWETLPHFWVAISMVFFVAATLFTMLKLSGISSLKSFIHIQFLIKDLGMLKYFLGVEVARSKKGIFLSQRKYVLDLLSETGKLGARPCSAPMTSNMHRTGEGELFDNPKRYRRLVGKLNYLTVTRPDIAYSVSVVSQFLSSPTVHHWAALVQILCYLKGAPGRGILYENHGHNRIECFSDADWAGSIMDRKSTSGYCVFVGGNLVSWKSKKQNVVSRSSAELEYRAMAQSVCEIVWIYQLLTEVGLGASILAKLWCDNQAALHIASNPVFHERTKHIEIDCHFIREKIQQGLISTGYVKTGEQLGDIFSKALNGVRVDYLCNKLGMINIYAPT